jgi:hypothetical protein
VLQCVGCLNFKVRLGVKYFKVSMQYHDLKEYKSILYYKVFGCFPKKYVFKTMLF